MEEIQLPVSVGTLNYNTTRKTNVEERVAASAFSYSAQ